MATVTLGKVGEQPAMVAQYGRPKIGKTTDGLLSFPRAVWLAAPGALKASVGVCGYEPRKVFYVETVAEATSLIANAPADKFDAVVCDDTSLLLQRTVASLEKRMSGYDLWGAVYKQTLGLRETSRGRGMHVVFNCHEMPPGKDDSGRYWLGTLALPGKKLPYELPAACDVVIRAVPCAADEKPDFGWPAYYLCDPANTEWLSGDRHNVLPPHGPMNLGEALRLVGRIAGNPKFGPRRLEGLEWQEPLVEKAAQMLIGKLDEKAHVKAVLSGLFDKAMRDFTKDDRHAMWAVRDAYDRAVLLGGLAGHRRRYYQF